MLSVTEEDRIAVLDSGKLIERPGQQAGRNAWGRMEMEHMRNQMYRLRLAVAPALLIFVIGCGGSSSPPGSPSPAPGGPSTSVTIPVGASSLGKAAYMPDDLNVAVGATVTWTNSDSVPHTSTSDAAGWNSGTVAPGGQFSFSFQSAGTFPYHCTIHPGMVGTVVVR